MRVFIAGATGVLGRRLVADLADRGHAIVGLTRTDSGDELVRARGGDPRRGDVLDRDSLRDAAAGADAVVHAATAIPTARKPTDGDWERNDRVRREGARNLTAVAADVGADRFVQQSVVWVARQPDGSRFDETAKPNPDRTTQSALDAERIAREAAREAGFETTVLRCGFFYAHDSAHTRTFGEELLAGNMPILGGGLLGRKDAELSVLHVDDAARAFAEAVESDSVGLYHVVDEEHVTTADFIRAFADRLDAPEPRRVPVWLAKYLAGEATVRLLTSPMPTTAERFRRDFDWEPRYPTYREGLDAVVERWCGDGTVRETAAGYEWRGKAVRTSHGDGSRTDDSAEAAEP
ncbi:MULTISPECIES: NAD(P)-dependent oxidoreductase [Halorussus]|uniref:NAD-dependent epimerase/dehydratase family protein n=1 Tax=Halorussus TaxID=1070314 RepID=UPI000E20CEEF|nr:MULTISPECIES: NAD(P)-dependent oxidoreductase [Halorussus]NHN58905.1 NAD(P)-dependent oxidoreductase [Halorussus sp. JP-T4]